MRHNDQCSASQSSGCSYRERDKEICSCLHDETQYVDQETQRGLYTQVDARQFSFVPYWHSALNTFSASLRASLQVTA